MRKGLMVTTEFPPLPGGIGNHAFNLTEQLAANGFEMTVLTNSRDAMKEEDFSRTAPFRIEWIKRSSLVLSTYLNRIRKFRKLSRELEKEDTLFVSGKFSLFMLGLLGKGKCGRCMAIIHGTELRQGALGSKLIQRALNQCSITVSVSTYTRDRLHDLYEVSLDKSVVINNGFKQENRDFTPDNYHTPFRLVTVGNLTRRKGQHNVIRALPAILNTIGDTEYHVIGLPSELEMLEEQVRGLELQGKVIFHGALDQEAKSKILAESDLFIMLSLELDNGDFEGFGIAILEAGEYGLPAIGSVSSGIADAIASGESGLLVNPDDTNEIAQAVQKVRDSYASFSKKAYEHSSEFHWDKVIRKYLAVLGYA